MTSNLRIKLGGIPRNQRTACEMLDAYWKIHQKKKPKPKGIRTVHPRTDSKYVETCCGVQEVPETLRLGVLLCPYYAFKVLNTLSAKHLKF